MSLSQALNHSFIKSPLNEMGIQSGKLEMGYSAKTSNIQDSLSLECEAQKILEQVRQDQAYSPSYLKVSNIMDK